MCSSLGNKTASQLRPVHNNPMGGLNSEVSLYSKNPIGCSYTLYKETIDCNFKCLTDY